MKTRRLILLLSLLATTTHAAGIDPPPGLVAMWEGRDGASVRAALWSDVAQGSAPGSTAMRRLDAGESCWWLGVQHARAGRADSALVSWRRAWALRGDFDEGFALVDALVQRGRPADLLEAQSIAATLAEQSRLSVPRRAVEAHARWAWTLAARGRADSAWLALDEHGPAIARRAQWRRLYTRLALANDRASLAWVPAADLSALGRGRDAEADSLFARAARALGHGIERRGLTATATLEKWLAPERALLEGLGGTRETLAGPGGFPLQVLLFGEPTLAKPAVLLLTSPSEAVDAPDSLVAACLADGRAVVVLEPRGANGSVGAGVFGPDAWLGRGTEELARAGEDARFVLERLSRRGFGRAGWVIAAVGDRAPAGLDLLRDRRDARALVLVAPRLPVVEVAEYRARLRANGARVFVQVSPEEPEALELGDLLARQTESGQVRVADSALPGRATAIFRADPRVPTRLLRWLEERPAPKR